MSRVEWKPENDTRWKREDNECLKWPSNNVICKEVFVHIYTGYRIIRRFNELGTLIFSNEDSFKMRTV